MQKFSKTELDYGTEYNLENVKVVFGNSKLEPNLLSANWPNINFIQLNQVHSTIITQQFVPNEPSDGHQWDDTNLAVIIKTADCVPLITYDHTSGTLTNIHCGRKGLVDGILNSFLKISSPDSEHSFFIGPHIETYEIGKDMSKDLGKYGVKGLYQKDGKHFLSLSELIKNFIANNFKHNRIYSCSINTLIDDKYWSYRRNSQTKSRNFSFACIEGK